MSIKRFITKKTVAAAVAGTSLMSAGLAFAAWDTSGTGNGYASAITANNVATVVATTTADLYPGNSTGTLYLDVANNNPFPVTVTAVNPGSGSVAADAAHASPTGTCTTTGVSLNTPLTMTQVIPAHSAGFAFTVANTVSMSNLSSNGCQGATFTIPVSLVAGS